MLGISQEEMKQDGAVSARITAAMAQAALLRSRANFALAESAILGPSGGTPEKPVGLAYIALISAQGEPRIREFRFAGSRQAIRDQIAHASLSLLLEKIR